MAKGRFLGRQDADGAAVDGSQRRDDALAVAAVQFHGAALVRQRFHRGGGRVVGGGHRFSGRREIKQCRARQVVGRQQRRHVGGLLGRRHSVFGDQRRHTGLGRKGSRTGAADGLLGREGRMQEQLGILGHDADIGRRCVDGVGARAGTGDDRDLRHDAGHARDLRRQGGRRVEQVQPAVEFGAGGVIERHDRGAGLGRHLQHADLALNVRHRYRLAVFVQDIHALAVGAAIRRADGAVGVQRRKSAVVKKCCKKFFLAGFVCCHTVTS